jgi:hypothetical protein
MAAARCEIRDRRQYLQQCSDLLHLQHLVINTPQCHTRAATSETSILGALWTEQKSPRLSKSVCSVRFRPWPWMHMAIAAYTCKGAYLRGIRVKHGYAKSSKRRSRLGNPRPARFSVHAADVRNATIASTIAATVAYQCVNHVLCLSLYAMAAGCAIPDDKTAATKQCALSKPLTLFKLNQDCRQVVCLYL